MFDCWYSRFYLYSCDLDSLSFLRHPQLSSASQSGLPYARSSLWPISRPLTSCLSALLAICSPPWPFWSEVKRWLTRHMSEHAVRRVSIACLSSKCICVIAIISSNGLHAWFSFHSVNFDSNSTLGCKCATLLYWVGRLKVVNGLPLHFM